MVSNDTMDNDSDWQQREDVSSKQVEDTEGDAISEDSLDVGSLQLQRKTSKGKHPKYIGEEDIISDDQMESHFQKRQKRIPESRQGKYLTGKDIISDDQLELKMKKQQRRNPKSRQAKYLNEEDIASDDQLEGHYRRYHSHRSFVGLSLSRFEDPPICTPLAFFLVILFFVKLRKLTNFVTILVFFP